MPHGATIALDRFFPAARAKGGARMFGLASERTFRRVTYAMVVVAAVISFPLLDPLLRG